MTVEVLNTYSGPYITNGVTTVFPISFQAGATDEVAAVLNGFTLDTSSFAVTLNDDGTGSATFYTAPAAGVLFLTSDPTFAQEDDYQNQGPFFQKDVTRSLDRAARRSLWLRERALRSITLGRGATGDVANLFAGCFIGVNASGNAVGLSGTGADAALRTDLASVIGASLINYKPLVALAVSRGIDALFEQWIDVRSFGAVCNGVVDDTVAVQKCINFCLSTTQPRPMRVPGPCKLTASLIVNRKIGTFAAADMDTNDVGDFRIIGEGSGAGFYASSAITMFHSTLIDGGVAANPSSHQVRFENILFSSSDANLAVYAASYKFLRIRFNQCTFLKMKVMSAVAADGGLAVDTYAQDWHFMNCNFRRWKGVTFNVRGAIYNSTWIDCTWEFGEDGINSTVGGFYGSKVAFSIFEGSRRFFRQAGSGATTFIGCYTEGNTKEDYTFTSVADGGSCVGLTFQGNVMFVFDATNVADPTWANVVLGDVRGTNLGGNYCNWNMYSSYGLGVSTEIPDFSRDYVATVASGGSGNVYPGQGLNLDDPARPNNNLRVFGKDYHRTYASRGKQYVAVGFGGSLNSMPGITLRPEGIDGQTAGMFWGPANPGSGYYGGTTSWRYGDIMINSKPDPGDPVGWACTAGGVPGTWKTWGVVGQAIGAKANSVALGVNSVAAPTQAEFNALVTQFNLLKTDYNLLLAQLRTILTLDPAVV